MSGKQFVDTNILIYAHDLDAGHKRRQAAAVIRDLWDSGLGMISVQVLQEFHVNVTRKIPRPLPLAQARRIIESYSTWHVEIPGPTTVLRASEIQERNRLSFWDAMIVATAEHGNAQKILSEDLNPGQLIEGIPIENPFLP